MGSALGQGGGWLATGGSGPCSCCGRHCRVTRPVSGGHSRGDSERCCLSQVPDAVGSGGHEPGVRVVGCRQCLPDRLQHSKQKEGVEKVSVSGRVRGHEADHEL